MTVQPLSEIPPHIEWGLLAGTYERDGGVIRAASTGRLVKLLKDANPSTMHRKRPWRPSLRGF